MAKRFMVLVVLAVVAAAAAPASADGNKLSIGYAYLKSLEDGGGSNKLGAFVSFAPGDDSGLELDFGFHRDDDFDVNTFTGSLGPRFSLGEGSPFLHVMGTVFHTRFPGDSDTSFGGTAGAGYDLGTGGSVALRLGADLQILFDNGENFKSLRLGIGLTF